MSASLSFTEADVFETLRGLLLTMVPSGVEIIRAQVNRTPSPKIADYIVMTQILRTRLSTNVDTYNDGFPGGPSVKNALQSTQLDIQIDVHGPASAENTQIISTLFRDDYSTDFFDHSGIDAQALYASDPRQVPFVNGESQWESRWCMDLSIQVNQVVQVPQDFAATVVISPVPTGDPLTGMIDIDVRFPP
jgi:hypothetical protein